MAGRVVVGVDGSEQAREALHEAAAHARLRHAELEIVLAFESPERAAPYYADMWDWTASREEAQRSAEQHLQQVVEEAGIEGAVDRLVTRVEEGVPADVLLRSARGADLLVVGTRGRGALSGALLGSVSQHAIRHAPCPVLVVPAARTSEEGRQR